MSNVIDQRVVEMKFDNKNFESNVQTSLSTLDKLKKGLNLSGASKGLEDVGSSAKKIDLSGIGSAVESISSKFSAFGIMGVTALANITNSAVNTGKRIVSALTIDPITTGLQEYETQINAIQTILANTSHNGTTLDQVNAALNELNKYADMTIYNFTEMTRNIGTFTAAGLDLDTSVKGIQGIANLAAVSGSTSAQASTAMYQLSQAMAAGTVTLQDWNSVVNASMGGKVFQDAIIQTAKDIGMESEAVQAAVAAYEGGANFRSILNAQDNEAWLSSDILIQALSKFTKTGAVEYLSDLYDISGDSMLELQKLGDEIGYSTDAFNKMALSLANGDKAIAKNISDVLTMADTATRAATEVKTFSQLWDTMKETAQSGWTKSWEIIIGDFGEAKELLTEISNILGGMIDESSNSRNSLLLGGLGSGWKQLLDNGIVDSVGFQDTITDVAKTYGRSVESMMHNGDTFQETLKRGWLTSDILGDSITEYGKKLRGLSAEQREEMGVTLDQIQTYTEFENKVKDGTISLEEFQKILARPSGRENLIEALRNSLVAVTSVLNPIKQAFRDIFPATTGEQLYQLTVKLKDFTARLKLSETASENLSRTFKGLFAVLDIIKHAFTVLFAAVKPWLSGLDDMGGGILSVTAKIGDWLVSLRDGVKGLSAFAVATKSLAAKNQFVSVVKDMVAWFKELGKVLNTKFVAPGLEELQNLLDRIKERMSDLSSTADRVKTVVSNAFKSIGDAISTAFGRIDFFNLLGTLWNGLTTLGTGVVKAVGALAKGFSGIFAGANFNSFFDIINSFIAGGVGVGIIKFLNGAKDAVDGIGDTFGGLKGMLDSATEILDSFRRCLEAYQTKLKAETLKTISVAIAILVGSLLVVSLIDSEKLSKAVGAITMLFAGLVGSMAVLDKLTTGVKGASKLVSVMVGMAVSVLILAGALKKVSAIDSADLTKSLLGVAALAGILIGTVKILSANGGATMKGAAQLVIFSAALKILASVCYDMSTMPWENMARGLIGVAALMTMVSLFLNATKFNGKSIATAAGIVLLAAALKILASVCQTFADMSWEEIAKGLVSVGALLAELALFVNLTGNAKHVISTGIALTAIAAAMKILASAMQDFAGMRWGAIAKGLVAMGVALAAIAVSVNFMPKSTLLIGVGLIAVAAALLLVAEALNKMGSMSWEEVAKGFVTLGGAMAIFAIGLNVMKGTLGGAAALLIASVALLALIPTLTILGNLSWEQIAKGLIVLAGAFGIIGVAGALLGPIVPTILGLAGSFALIGVAVLGIGAGLLAAGAGLSALAAGFAALATAGAAGATALVAAITIIITGIIALIPAILSQVGDIVVAICKVIAESAPAIAEAINAIVLSTVDVLVTYIPVIADGVLKLVVGVLEALVEYGPKIVDLVFQFVIDVINVLADRLPELIQAVVNLLMSFFSGIVEALKGVDVSVMLEAIVGLGLISAIMVSLAAIASLIPGAMIGVLGIGAVIAEMALVLAAIGALAQIPGLDWLIGEGGDLLQSIGTAIGKFIGGIAGGVAEGFTSSLPKIGTDLSGFMTNVAPFIEGAKNINQSVLDGVRALAEVILILTAANILDGLTSWFTGGSALDKFGAQLPTLGSNLNAFATNLGTFGDAQINTVKCAALAVKELATAADTIPNSGGWVAKIVGENSITAFSSELPILGANLRLFATSLGTFGDAQIATVKCAASAVKEMADAADSIPNAGGWVAKLVGDNSIAAFSSELPILGMNLRLFATNLGTFGEAQILSISCAANAVKEMANAAGSIDGQAGWAKALFGDNSIATFSSEMPVLGTNLNAFITNLGTFGDAQITTTSSAVKAINALATLADSDLKGAKKNLEGFGDKIVQLAKDIASFVSGMPASSSLTTAISNVNKILKMIDDISGADANIAVNFTKSLGKIGKDGVKSFVEAFTSSSAKSDVKKAAIELIEEVSKGAESKLSDIKDAFKKLATAGKDAIRDKHKDFKDAGKYLVSGFADGISANTYQAEAKARAMALAAAEAAEEALKINSPSKVGYGIGNFFGQGFVNGLDNYAIEAYLASSNMATSARDGLRDSLNNISNAIENDIDSQPIIRPVLDLSNVQSGANAINGMFNSRASMNVLASVGSINNMMNRSIQNGKNSDVISAIDKLNKNLGENSGNTYTVNGITYDDGSNISNAVKELVRAARVERRK